MSLGNNSQLIAKLISRRPWWKSSSETYRLVNFYWKMSLKDFNFGILNGAWKDQPRSLNRFERHQQIGSKDNLFRNLHFYCEVTSV